MTARGDEDAELSQDADALVPIEQLVAEVVDGDGELHDVRMTQAAALVTTPETGEVDLARSVVTRAQCFADKDPHAPDARWELTVDVDGRPVQLYGQWLSFAWLGHLAGWPAPTP